MHCEKVKCIVPVMRLVSPGFTILAPIQPPELPHNVQGRLRRLLDIELERLEPPANGGAAGTLPSCSLLLHEDLDTSLAEAADTFSASVRVAQAREASTSTTVDLNILRVEIWGGVRQSMRADVIVICTFIRLNRGEGFRNILDVRWRCQGLLER